MQYLFNWNHLLPIFWRFTPANNKVYMDIILSHDFILITCVPISILMFRCILGLPSVHFWMGVPPIWALIINIFLSFGPSCYLTGLHLSGDHPKHHHPLEPFFICLFRSCYFTAFFVISSVLSHKVSSCTRLYVPEPGPSFSHLLFILAVSHFPRG